MPSVKENISKAVGAAVKTGVPGSEIFNYVEVPPNPTMGDYALPCFFLSKKLKKSPADIATSLASSIKVPEGVENVEAKGPYLNFFVSPSYLAASMLPIILKEKGKYGKNSSLKKKKIMVEYSSPNSNKPLHIGHVRNDSIGMCISKALEAGGAKVVKANLINDRGIHICKTMFAYNKWSDKKTPEKSGLKGDKFVGNLYVKFEKEAKNDPSLENEVIELLKKWENNDAKVISLWNKMNSWTLKGFKHTYKNYGSEFDVFFFESEFYNKAKKIIEDGRKKGLFKEDENKALYADLEKHGLPNKIVLRPDGTSIYLTNDLALTPYKFKKFKLNDSIWVVANEQNMYFMQLFKIFELLGRKWAPNARHLSYGLVKLPEGKLKSREGRVVDADQLLEELTDLAKKEIKKREPSLSAKELDSRSMKIALAAIKFFMLKIDASKDLLFNPAQAISFEGESGPYVQYTYARAKSILKKAGKLGKADYTQLTSDHEKKLVLQLEGFPGVIAAMQRNLSPHVLCQYLLQLCSDFNSFYHEIPVLKADPAVKEARLALVVATSLVIQNGLILLNMPVLERM